MTRKIAILRPEPGNAVTVMRVRDAGLVPIALPRFALKPLAWTAPDPGPFDALLLTSANAMRLGGEALQRLTTLPVLAVGAATATAARDMGFTVAVTGDEDVATLLAGNHPFQRLLWLAGRERTAIDHPAIAETIPVYASDAQPLTPNDATELYDSVALLHSTRAAIALAGEVDRHGIPRARLRIAAISAKVAAAAGDGWDRVAIADRPDDSALIATARALAPHTGDAPGRLTPERIGSISTPMTPDTPIPAPSRGNSLLLILVAGLIAFLAGLAVMAVLFRFSGWAGDAPAPAPVAAVGPVVGGAPPATTLPIPDVTTLAAREQALAARLDALDARLRNTDGQARTAASYAGRAEAMMLVFAARRAMERGQPLGFVDGELRARFGAVAPDAVATVIRASGEPVTLEDLRLAFDQIAPRLSTTGPGEGWWEAIQREMSTLVIVRKENAPSTHPRERLDRARRLLSQGHVEAALAEIARLPGAQGAESWMAAAGRYVETRRALDALEEAAIKAQVQPAPGARPAPATATTQD